MKGLAGEPNSFGGGVPISAGGRAFPRGLERAFGIVQDGVAAGHYPGAVAVVAGTDGTIEQKAFGRAMVVPAERPMTPDSLFDRASLG